MSMRFVVLDVVDRRRIGINHVRCVVRLCGLHQIVDWLTGTSHIFVAAVLSDNLQGGVEMLLKRLLPICSLGSASACNFKGAEAIS